MKKYFVVTDCHSFFTLMMNALIEKGFDINNKEHVLITCGDMFDRGDESKEMLDFLYTLYTAGRLIYIKGNHDDLFQDLVTRKNYFRNDISNGTIKTLGELQPDPIDEIRTLYNFPMVCNNYDKRIDELYSSALDYYETKNYIFVHGWIPAEDTLHGFFYDPKWRDSKEWDAARWFNGMDFWKCGIKEPGKTIICGHWHCSWGWSHLKQDRKEFPEKNRKNWEKSFEPFIDNGIIALDGCTAYSGIVNVLVLNEGDL